MILTISRPPDDRPFLNASPIPSPITAPPNNAQMIGSVDRTVSGKIWIQREVKVTVIKVKIVNFFPILNHAKTNKGIFSKYKVVDTGTSNPMSDFDKVVKI